ncbi:XRE family transcriptional regulator [Frondihabitans sp. PAMC 28766]|uniref:helix-turn-helix domain-containing protein n=1 Tax=Frondihabitans sp. PAMC 28766 TaxID=1795630 RepID=UPI00078EB47B|nr:helix-turn-helix transcriptional regulator [Frondihabitans sp. PAMC 28766]AMM20153.1 XRE family transcriptional regulator [Frondihabitans sp. PAMC 28766]
MDNSDEVATFLTTRRANVTPAQVELPSGPNRRVPGLRRTEVAMLAGVSVEYYSRLERGSLAGASDGVLHAVAQALLLNDDERAHLFDLAKAANDSPVPSKRRSTRAQNVRPSLQFILDAITGGPAFVRNGRLDILASNGLGKAVYADLYESAEATLPGRPMNLARYCFLDPDRSDRFYPDWATAADQTVAILRTEAGRDPYDKDLQDLIGELSTRSVEFRIRWGAHDVRRHATGMKHFIHPLVGPLDMVFEGTELVADPGLHLLIYAAEPRSATADALRLLALWTAAPPLDSADLSVHSIRTKENDS